MSVIVNYCMYETLLVYHSQVKLLINLRLINHQHRSEAEKYAFVMISQENSVINSPHYLY